LRTKEIDDFFDTKKAACRGEDITLFFPNLPAGQTRKDVQLAKQLCDQCEVVEGCLEYSLHFEPMGFWGGKTEVEREVLRRSKNISLPMDRRPSPSARRAANAGRLRKTAKRLDLANG
jgi:WhiB family redox-sensing transcriptional regulator